jgi:hypothetical protein
MGMNPTATQMGWNIERPIKKQPISMGCFYTIYWVSFSSRLVSTVATPGSGQHDAVHGTIQGGLGSRVVQVFRFGFEPFFGPRLSLARALYVDITAPFGGFRQDRDLVRQGFRKAAAYEHAVLRALGIRIPDRSYFKGSHEGRVTDQNTELPQLTRGHDNLGLFIDHFLLWGHYFQSYVSSHNIPSVD